MFEHSKLYRSSTAQLGSVETKTATDREGLYHTVFEKPPWGKIIKDVCMYESRLAVLGFRSDLSYIVRLSIIFVFSLPVLQIERL